MESILNAGILIILWLQSLGSWLIGPMILASSLGVEEFYLLIAPVVFWCIDPAFGLRLGIGLLLSGALNSILKLVFHGPRPYWYDGRVQGLSSEISFGAPSAHSQNAVVVWGLIAHRIHKTWAWVLAVFLILMISLSRMYLGMHFPSDVLIGWLVGLILLWLMIRLEIPLLAWLNRMRLEAQIGTVFSASLLLILAGGLMKLALEGWRIPPGWIELARRVPEAEPIQPLALSGTISSAAAMFGLAAGAILLNRRGWLNPEGTIWIRLARYLVGLAGVVLIWAGLDFIFPAGETFTAYIFRYLRYALVGLWISFLAPLVFYRIKLANPIGP